MNNPATLHVTKWASGDPYSREKGWRLLWAVPGESTIVYAEGECSRRVFRTRGAAAAYGRHQYGETAMRFPVHFDQW